MKKIIYGVVIVLFAGCNVSKEGKTWHPLYRVQAGLNKGGITENTDFSKTDDVVPDAFSGATNMGFNASGHTLLPLKHNSVETGVDYMYNKQKFTFRDATNGYNGTRTIGSSQIMVPITYNLGLFKKNDPLGMVQLKLGYLMQFNMFNVSNNGNSLTDYSLKHFSSGITFGVSITPLKLNNGNSLGLYFDGYRGSKIYNDYYNRSIYEMPASSFLKFGVIYQFGNKK